MPHSPMDGAWWIDSATQSLRDYGCASYCILIILRKVAPTPA